MKNLIYIFLSLGVIFSCSDDEATGLCNNDYAEFYYNDTLYGTSYTPDMSEPFNPRPESCGTAAIFIEDTNVFQLRFGVEGHAIDMVTIISNLLEKNEFTDIEYNSPGIKKSFGRLIPEYENYIQINELDIFENTIKGEFSFKIANSTGDTSIITEGKFNCPYQEF